MSTFKLEIITPEKQFFNGSAEQIICPTENGEIGILSGHMTMMVALNESIIKIKRDNEWKNAYISDGFVEVRPDEVIVFAEFCDWAENAELSTETRKKKIAENRKRHEQSIKEQKREEIKITRRIKSKKKKDINM